MTTPRIIAAQDGVTDRSDRALGDARRVISRGQWVDLGVVTALALVAMAGFRPPYGGTGFLLAVAGGVVVGIGSAVLGHRLRLNALNTFLVGVVAYFLLGTAFALPGAGIALVVPTLSSLSALAIGAVASWRDVLTLATPITGPDHMAVLPYVATAAALLVSATIILYALPRRPRSAVRAGSVLLGPIALLALTMASGTAEPFLAVLRGILFVLIAVVWLGRRARGGDVATGTAARGAHGRRLAGAAVVALAASVVAAGVGLVAGPAIDAQRFVLRDVVTPPFDPYLSESPLAGLRLYTKAMNETPLFTVEGLAAGDTVKLATLDEYTGRQWQIASPSDDLPDAGAYTLVGRDVPTADLLTASSTRDVSFTIDGYADLWLPSVGMPETITLETGSAADKRDRLRVNSRTGTGVVVDGLGAGDRYRMHSAVQDAPAAGALDNVPVARLALPPSATAPSAVTDRMQTYVRDVTSDFLKLRAIEQSLRSQGYLSHGTPGEPTSRAGHGLDRMEEMFEMEFLVGDEEQYASAMALMARELGFPARVVVGFAPESVPADGGAVTVTGDDVTAWVEVPFQDFGWVAFDPTPEQTDVPVNTQERPETKPKEQVRQPPQTEARPDDLATAAEEPDDEEPPRPPFSLPWWAVLGLSIVGLPLLAIGVPLLAAALARRRRRSRRRDRGSPDQRIAGAFDETVDRFAELGYVVPERETRRRTADAMHPALAPLAVAADHAVFAGEDPSPTDIERVWADADAATAAAAAESTRRRRLTARFRASGRRRLRARIGSLMTADRALLRNRILRSRGADRPSAETIARIEGVSTSEIPGRRDRSRRGTGT